MDILNKIIKIFLEAEEAEEKFVDVKTEDGRIMRVDDLAEGQPVMEVTEEGVVEVEDGSYVIVDAEGVPTAEVVVEGGVIASILDKAEESSDEEEEEKMESEEKEEEEVKLEEEVEISNADLAEALTTVANELKDLKSKFETSEKENAELKKEIEEFKAAPSEEHTKTKI